jgi:hypothetical protein
MRKAWKEFCKEKTLSPRCARNALGRPLLADFVAELGDYYVQGVAAFFSARP